MPERFFGYAPNPIETEKFCATIPAQNYAEIAHLAKFTGDGKGVYLWRPLVKCLGKSPGKYRLPARNQGNIGSCVGVADARCQDIVAAADIIERNEPEAWHGMHSAVAAYIAGRQAGNMLGGGDGCYGSAMAQAVREIGTAIQKDYGVVDLSSYSIDTIKKLDSRRSGLPRELVAEMNQHTIQQTARLTSLEQLDAVLNQYYAVNICSTFGSRDRQRDENGCLIWNGNWPHSMAVVGLHFVKYRGKWVRVYIIQNSWGSRWMSQGPLVVADMPMGSFGIYEWDMKRILDAGDTFARAGYRGFMQRDLDLRAVFNFNFAI